MAQLLRQELPTSVVISTAYDLAARNIFTDKNGQLSDSENVGFLANNHLYMSRKRSSQIPIKDFHNFRRNRQKVG
jgi:hypothetical protein